jgi:hypothetical protein
MYQRGSVGPGHWSRIIKLAEARGEVVTADMLIAFRDLRIKERAADRNEASRAPPVVTRNVKSKPQAAAAV